MGTFTFFQIESHDYGHALMMSLLVLQVMEKLKHMKQLRNNFSLATV